MISLNSVIISGNLTRDPEVRNNNILGFSLALNRSYKDKDGNWQDATDFIDVSVFGPLAQRASERLSKGSKVLVQGKLRSRSWNADDGSTRSKVEVIADDIMFLDKEKGINQNDIDNAINDIPFGQ